MKRSTLAAGVLLVLVSGTAAAHSDVGVTFSFGVPGALYSAPPPVYYTPPARYYTPPPAYYGRRYWDERRYRDYREHRSHETRERSEHRHW